MSSWRVYHTSTNTRTNSASLEYIIRVITKPVDPPLPWVLVDKVWDAIAWLELDLPCSITDIQDARRRLSRIHHPDVGGDLEAMKAINASADYLIGLAV